MGLFKCEARGPGVLLILTINRSGLTRCNYTYVYTMPWRTPVNDPKPFRFRHVRARVRIENGSVSYISFRGQRILYPTTPTPSHSCKDLSRSGKHLVTIDFIECAVMAVRKWLPKGIIYVYERQGTLIGRFWALHFFVSYERSSNECPSTWYIFYTYMMYTHTHTHALGKHW